MENVVATIKLENDHQANSAIGMQSSFEGSYNPLIKQEQTHENFYNPYGSYNFTNNEYIYNHGHMLKENEYYNRYAENFRQYSLYDGQNQYLQMFNNFSGYCQPQRMHLGYQNHQTNPIDSSNYHRNDVLFEYKDVSQLVSVETDKGGYESSENQEKEQSPVKKEPFDKVEDTKTIETCVQESVPFRFIQILAT